MYTVPIVTVYHPDLKGPVDINESDFNPKIHEIYDEEKHAKKGAKVVQKPNEKFGEMVGPFTVGKIKKKFVVLNVVGERISDDEYDSEGDAWGAATVLMAGGNSQT